jgi:hypothetical protein
MTIGTSPAVMSAWSVMEVQVLWLGLSNIGVPADGFKGLRPG